MRLPLLFLITLALLVFYTFLCISRVFPAHLWLSALASLAVIAFIVRMQLSRSGGTWPGRQALVWVSSVMLGIWSTFIIFCIFIDGANLVFLLLRIIGVEQLFGIDQYYWVAHAIRIAFFTSLVMSFLGLLQAISGPLVRKVAVPIEGLPAELVGLKIVQISDLHIGSIIRKAYISNVVRKVMALAPDIIAVTGDIADGQPEALREHAAPLAGLQAPLGTYFITGNHEYYSGVQGWIDEVRNLGMTPLLDENRVVAHKGKHIMIAGVTDLFAHRFVPTHTCDPVKAAKTDIECDFRMLLAHQPDSFATAQAAGFQLQLSGHTHAGQYFPFSVLVWLAKRYTRGLKRFKNMWIYVNPATGFWGAANRFLVPSEITLLELVKA